ncbi:hypothetical protein PTSG_03158 [Salpingoeca rosetta]|uniref:CCHC-type domain-containing protein n=1 Tax=Salpingoeca rosetta (strain ATCC 50818 / BSB-021) TaxID=946362 RepID=F2U4E3_SALR5|nr:uncharacterized protein PTSG_03158 [Salpingoeca rosetta]EGD82509.1 hypothetical protein PTSG_03158 [Salpingoeca rosetta]|eukprot:XP_004995745.1 hypothetical protein PTSG_03158 [Salpingoeca rosetta]
MSSDEEFVPDEADMVLLRDDDDGDEEGDEEGHEEPPTKRAMQRTRKSAPKPKPKPGTKQHTTTQKLAKVRAHLKDLRGQRGLTERETLTLLHVYIELKLKHEMNRGKSNGEPSDGPVDQRVAELLGIGLSTVRRKYALLNKLFEEHGVDGLERLFVENRRGKNTKLPTRVPTTKRVLRQVRDFVQMQTEAGQRVTAVQVFKFLRQHGHVDVQPSFLGDDDDEQDKAAALRSVQRFLQRAGYLRRKKHVVQGKLKHARLLVKYLKELDANRQLSPAQRLREVYLDESYVDNNNSNNDQGSHRKTNRGRRYCFALAVQGPDPRTCVDGDHDDRALAGPVPNSPWIFDPSSGPQRERQQRHGKQQQQQQRQQLQQHGNMPQQSSRKCGRCKQPGHTRRTCPVADDDLPQQQQQPKQRRARSKAQRGAFHTGDYHKAFNAQNFLGWFKEALLPNLHQPSLIIMDNAAYHRTLPADTPVPEQMNKADVIAALQARGVAVSETDFASELRLRLQQWVNDNVQPEVVQLAAAQGHRVLFSPPSYSDLNPMEVVLALIKGNVARRGKTTATSATSTIDVGGCLEEEIQQLAQDRGQYRKDGKTRVQAIIDSVDTQLERQRRILDEREQDEHEDEHEGEDEGEDEEEKEGEEGDKAMEGLMVDLAVFAFL